jgi:predicted lactoylglutathione lyase
MDMKIDPQYGNIYWNEPDGHMWEILTISYARQRN